LADINPGANGSNAHYVAKIGNLIFFTADQRAETVDHSAQHELWLTDGTSSGTIKLADVNAVAGTALNGKLIFALDQTSQIWSSDGTASGTKRLKQIF